MTKENIFMLENTFYVEMNQPLFGASKRQTISSRPLIGCKQDANHFLPTVYITVHQPFFHCNAIMYQLVPFNFLLHYNIKMD